jgi:DNA ligase D-like protein (predicted ligase)
MKYKPMLAKIGKHTLLEDDTLIFEPKVDGIRALCEISPTCMKFFSRNGHDITAQFPEFQFRHTVKAKNCILDGEIVVINKKGFPDFNLLQGRSQLTDKLTINKLATKHPAQYAVFDILNKNNISLIKEPYSRRHKILHQTVNPAHGIELLPSTHEGKKLFAQMKKANYEGVIAKDPDAPYSPGKRTRAWQKIKFLKSCEAVVLGFTQDKKLVSSLLLGLYDNKGNLTYAGKVGTGFSQEKITELYPKLLKLKTHKPAATDIPETKNMILVKPKIVVEVKYLERTKSGALRHSAYLHIRYDKKAKECTTNQF